MALPVRSAPTSSRRRAAGPSARNQIVEAAARLFAENGYAATSTRAIAGAVGVKQASIYYHFATKEDILAALLASTVRPSLTFAATLTRSRTPAHVQLYALTYFDVSLLADGPTNIGTLYQLPEVRLDRFAEFRRDRARLRDVYGRRIKQAHQDGTLALTIALPLATELAFALAESIISIRAREDLDLSMIAPTTAGSCLRMLRCPEDAIEHAEVAARPLLAQGFRATDSDTSILHR